MRSIFSILCALPFVNSLIQEVESHTSAEEEKYATACIVKIAAELET